MVDDIIVDETSNSVRGIVVEGGQEIESRSVVITTGTFLRGIIHLGPKQYPAGRHYRDSDDVEAPSIGLAATLERLQFPIARLSTGVFVIKYNENLL